MRTYADPTRCPDCSAALAAGASRCDHCGLVLTGPLGQQLFGTLLEADRLLGLMRSASVTAPAVTVGAPPVPAPPRTPVLRGASVPRILLALGALCLLVAAVVFLVVTWSVMGVGGRTLTLVALTVTGGALTAWAARSDLRGAVEALGLVTLGLVTLDLLGARDAGWLGDPSTSTFLAVLGLVMYAAALGAAYALRRSPAAGFTAGEVVAALAALVAGIGLAGGDWADSMPILVAVLVAAALTALPGVLRRAADGTGWLVALVGTATVTTVFWSALVLVGLDDVSQDPTLRSVWLELDGWPLVAAGLLALAVAALRSVSLPLRLAAANLGVLVLTVVAIVPAFDGSTTAPALALAAVAVVMAALATTARGPWGLSSMLATVSAGAGMVIVLVQLVTTAGARGVRAAGEAWAAPADLRLPSLPSEPDIGAPWLVPVLVVALLAAAVGVVHLAATDTAAQIRVRRWLPLTGVVVAVLTLVTTLALYPTPVWVVLALLLALAAGLSAYALRADHAAATAVAGVVLLVALAQSAAAELLTAVAALVAVLLAGAHHLFGVRRVITEASAVALAAAVALLCWATGALVDAAGSWTALVGLLVLAALGIGRGYLPERLVRAPGRVGLEAGALAAALPLALAGLTDYGVDQAIWGAAYLTVAGTAVSLVALLHHDRREVGWLGGLLLVLASWVRLGDLGVEEPEAYTLPAAVALLVVGLLQLRREPDLSTFRALGAGLGLALVPSLLWALEDPISLRALLLGLATLALVVAGALQRWAAPLVAGTLVGALLVVREAAPWIGEAVPRWGLIGLAGALLIAMGVTWERRLRDAQTVVGYVRGLR